MMKMTHAVQSLAQSLAGDGTVTGMELRLPGPVYEAFFTEITRPKSPHGGSGILLPGTTEFVVATSYGLVKVMRNA